MGTPVGSAILDNEIVKFFEELIEFYGHGSPQARIIERVKRRLELVPVGDKYERLCPTCKCPACGKTRSQAAAINAGVNPSTLSVSIPAWGWNCRSLTTTSR